MNTRGIISCSLLNRPALQDAIEDDSINVLDCLCGDLLRVELRDEGLDIDAVCRTHNAEIDCLYLDPRCLGCPK